MYQLLFKMPSGRSRVMEFTQERVLIGRSPQCDIYLDAPDVAALHATIVYSMGQLFIHTANAELFFVINSHTLQKSALLLADQVLLPCGYIIVVHQIEAASSISPLHNLSANQEALNLLDSTLELLTKAPLDNSSQLLPSPNFEPEHDLVLPSSIHLTEPPHLPDSPCTTNPDFLSDSMKMHEQENAPSTLAISQMESVSVILPVAEPLTPTPMAQTPHTTSGSYRLICVSGSQKGTIKELSAPLSVITIGNSTCILAIEMASISSDKEAARLHLTHLEGPVPFINRSKANKGPNPLIQGTLIGFTAGIYQLQSA